MEPKGDDTDSEDSVEENNKSEWERVANAVDRFCLFLSLIATTVLILFLSIGIHLGE